MVLLDEVTLEVLAEPSRPGFGALRIVNESQREPDYERMVQAIMSDERICNARELQISGYSLLDRLDFIDLMPMLGWLRLAGGKISDCRPVVKKSSWHNVNLSLDAMTSLNFSSLNGLSAHSLYLEGPNIEHCAQWPAVKVGSLGIYQWPLDHLEPLMKSVIGSISLQDALTIQELVWPEDKPLTGLNVVECAQLERFGQMNAEILSIINCPRLNFHSITNIQGIRRLELKGPDVEHTLRRVPAIETLEILILRVQRLPEVLPEFEKYRSLKKVFVCNALDWRLEEYRKAWPRIDFSGKSSVSIFAGSL